MIKSHVQKKSKITYPKITISLNEFRREEVKLSKFSKKGSSFFSLFGQRIKGNEGKTVSVILDVDIETGDSYCKYKKNSKKTDEYNIKSDKVIKQIGGGFVVKKTYGPFTVEFSKNHTKRDAYKFMMYTLLKQKFTILSGEYINKLGCRIVPFNKKQFLPQKMGKLKLDSYLLSKQRPIKSHGVNTCVVDYVWDQVRGKRGFKTYDYAKLKAEIYEFVTGGDMISTEESIDWVKNCHPRVAVHAFDSRYRNFIRYTNGHQDVVLVYIVKDNHCYPITDEKLKLIASKANQGGCDNLLKHMTDLKWTRRHKNVAKLKSIEDILSFDKENHIIVLPENTKMRAAIDMYSNKESFYVEYLHWDNRGVLDGFIYHKKNMYLLNEEYDMRKTITNKLFKTYLSDDFIWTNQSYTSIASSLFKQMCGYLPESSYNLNTRQMLDDFYPRALQWCSTDDMPDDVVNIDICKSYPNILLHNT